MEGAEAEGDALDGGRGERDGTFLLWISAGLGERILPRINCFIDATQSATIDEEYQAFVWRRNAYQSLVGRLTWLSTNTRPDLSTVVSFLSSYSSCPTQQHI